MRMQKLIQRANASLKSLSHKSSSGLTMWEMITVIVVIVILGGVGVGLLNLTTGRSREAVAANAGSEAQQAIQQYYSDYGSVPASAAAVDAYLATYGDDSPIEGAPEGTDIVVYADGSGLPNGFAVQVTGDAFGNAIVIDRNGIITKEAGTTFTPFSGTAIATWSN